MTRTVLWQSLWFFGAERCTLSDTADGHRLEGQAVLAVDERPLQVSYRIEVDGAWITRRVDVDAVSPDGLTEIRLQHDGVGTWTSGDGELPLAASCLDVDLGLSPSTNTLPIRRLAELPVGGGTDLVAVWVEFPSLRIKELPQRYERLGDRRWRYSSGSFNAILEVDEDGLVLDYAGAWKAVATG